MEQKASEIKIPSKSDFAKLSQAEQQKWIKWEENYLRNVLIVDPVPEEGHKHGTEKT